MFPFVAPYNMFYYNDNTYYPFNMPFPHGGNSFDDYWLDADSQIQQGDPPPILSNNPPTTAIVLRKELTGYPNYGNPSGNADILYTGNQGTWTFNLPAFLSAAVGRFRRVELVIRGALDDHYNVPANRYSMTVNIDGSIQRFTDLPFVHGRPAGQRFNNWNQLIIPIPAANVRRNNRVTIRNTSNTGENDFIAFDWMEMRFYL